MAWPHWIYGLHARLRSIVRTRRADVDLNDEVSFHVEMQTRENLRRGMTEAEASRLARVSLGGIEQTKEHTREGRPLYAMQTMMQDIRYALRLMRRSPGFATVVVLTVALGVGANTAIFSIVNGVLLRPLPYPDEDRLVRLYLANPAQDVGEGLVSVPEIDDWRSRVKSIGSLTGFSALTSTMTGVGDPTEVQAAYVVGDFFGTLGGTALLGRTLNEDDVRSAIPNAVISERLWKSRFSGDPRVLGKPMTLGTHTYTIVGVVPSSFRYPLANSEVWAPHSVMRDEEVGPRVRNQRVLEVVARLAPTVTVQQAQNELNAVVKQLETEFPQTNRGWSAARAVPLRTAIIGSVDTALLVVLAVVSFILLIACANLANLMLARGTARAHEIATRAALGAGRTRILRQLLTESLVLGVLGGAIGIAASVWGVQTLLAMSADTLPRVEDVRLDWLVIGFGLAVACLTSVLFGILPALRAASADPQQSMRGGRGSVGGSRRLRNALVVAEVALAVVLVIGAGLMARSFVELRRVDPGFDRSNVLAVTVQFNVAGVSGDLGAHLVQRREEMIQRVGALPGVLDAGGITNLPLEGECRDTLSFLKPGTTPTTGGGVLRAANCLVSPGYLKAMRIPLLRGEPLPDQRPAQGAPTPILISEAAARRFWPNEDPIGQVMRANYGGQAVVVGIVGDVRQHGLAKDPPPVVYLNHRTAPRIATTIVVRTAGDPMLLAGPIRELVRTIDPNQPIRSITTLDEVFSESIARDRFFTLLFGVFGSLALLLAAIGVYGVLAYSVGQRTREIGVRMALGARVSDVLRMIVSEGMLLVLLGVAVGALASLALTRALQSQLFHVSARDPLTFVVAPAALLVVALFACYLPARRATGIEPVTALRAE